MRFLACSKLSDSGEDAKVKDALSGNSAAAPDSLRRSLEQVFQEDPGGATKTMAVPQVMRFLTFFYQEDMTISLSGWLWDGQAWNFLSKVTTPKSCWLQLTGPLVN